MNNINQSLIGTPWYGKHVVTLRCRPITNKLLSVQTSIHAPVEPFHPECMESVAQLLRIGYELKSVIPYQNDLIYVLIK